MNKTIEEMINKEERALTMKGLLETVNSLHSKGHAVVTTDIIEDIRRTIDNFPRFTDYIGRINRGYEMEKVVTKILKSSQTQVPPFVAESLKELVS